VERATRGDKGIAEKNARMWSAQLVLKVWITYCHFHFLHCSDLFSPFFINNYDVADQTEGLFRVCPGANARQNLTARS